MTRMGDDDGFTRRLDASAPAITPLTGDEAARMLVSAKRIADARSRKHRVARSIAAGGGAIVLASFFGGAAAFADRAPVESASVPAPTRVASTPADPCENLGSTDLPTFAFTSADTGEEVAMARIPGGADLDKLEGIVVDDGAGTPVEGSWAKVNCAPGTE